MKWKDFFLSKSIFLCFYGIAMLILAVFLLVSEISLPLLLTAELFLIVILLGYLAVSYRFEKKKLDRLKRTISKIPEKYLLGEVLPEPHSALEREYFDIMRTVSRSAIGAAESAVREKEEYCEYVERWIHELKTPLTACSLILDNGGDVKKLRRELKRAENQTENILYYARLKSPEKDLLPAECDVSEIIGEAVRSQADILTAAGNSVRVEGNFETVTDRKSVLYILQQLLTNCAKYAPKCEIAILARDSVISVEDRGMGIPSHELGKITERGYTGTNGRTRGESTGMGLYLAQGLCSLLGIELFIESEVGSFTRVTLKFPNVTKL